ncbi:MAG: B12-binding domain-containing radical SAM protein [Magnetospirillum sp. WYHS-4]
MARISLIRPSYSSYIYEKTYKIDRDDVMEYMPPLGLLSIAGYLMDGGHKAEIIDGEREHLDAESTVEMALKSNPDIVGITSTSPEYPFARDIIRRVKERCPATTTVFGGAHITALPQHTIDDLAPFVDYGVIWEGEKPMRALADGDVLDRFVWDLRFPRLLKAPQRLTGGELDSFFPDRNAVRMKGYQLVDPSVGLVQADGLQTARGCPFGCNFCTSRQTRLACRSIERVIEEILNCVERHGARMFIFYDDTLTIEKDRIMALCDGIIHLKRKGRIPEAVGFYCLTRASTICDIALLVRMKEAGFNRITMGIESGNSDIMKAMKKGCTLDDYRTAYAMFEELGITKRGSFIIGHPFESEETIRDSIDFALELNLDEVGVNILTPYPGQEVYRDAHAGRGLWLSHPAHYPELHQAMDWHAYWSLHRRWGAALVETATLSSAALEYWHARFLQEVYGAPQMAKRRERQLLMGNTDPFWHRPWITHAKRNAERLAAERGAGMPAFPKPLHHEYTYRPIWLEDVHKSEHQKAEPQWSAEGRSEQVAT